MIELYLAFSAISDTQFQKFITLYHPDGQGIVHITHFLYLSWSTVQQYFLPRQSFPYLLILFYFSGTVGILFKNLKNKNRIDYTIVSIL